MVMGAIGGDALVGNAGVALTPYWFRRVGATMRPVRICPCNDALGSLAMLLADLVGRGMGALGPSGGWQILRQARSESHTGMPPRAPAAGRPGRRRPV